MGRGAMAMPRKKAKQKYNQFKKGLALARQTLGQIRSLSRSMSFAFSSWIYGIIALLVIATVLKNLFGADVEITSIEIPKQLTDLGYTSGVVTSHLMDDIKNIEEYANLSFTPAFFVKVEGSKAANEFAQFPKPQLKLDSEAPNFAIPGTGIPIAAVVSYIASYIPSHSTQISGDIIQVTVNGEQQVQFHLRTDGKGTIAISEPISLADLNTALQDSAKSIVEQFEPLTFAAYLNTIGSTGDLQMAAEIIDEIIDTPSTSGKTLVWAHYLRGIVFYKQGYYTAAMSEYQTAYALNRKFVPAYNNLGYVIERMYQHNPIKQNQDRLDQAIDAFNKAINIDNDFLIAHYNLGIAYGYKDQYEDAIKQFEYITGKNSQLASAWNELCWNRAIANYLDDALKACNRSLDLDPSDPNTYDSRGFVYLKLAYKYQNSDKQKMMIYASSAIDDYNTTLNIYSDYASSYFGRGLAKQIIGDHAGENVDIAKAIKIEPDIANAFSKWIVKGS
jgi:tetratricopeptide (TPR) repeat protein